jgi:hypothetical protein
MLSRSIPLCAALALLVLPAAASSTAAEPGAVILSNGTRVPQALHRKPLHLTDAQRSQIRDAVLTENTQIEFNLKANKSAKDFTPAVGAKLPKGVKGLGLPQALLVKQPQLADYGYVKMKNQVLIVNQMTHTIVDLIPQA